MNTIGWGKQCRLWGYAAKLFFFYSGLENVKNVVNEETYQPYTSVLWTNCLNSNSDRQWGACEVSCLGKGF